MEATTTRHKVAIYSLFFISIGLIGVLIYQSKTVGKNQITLDAYKEALRVRDSILIADKKMFQEEQRKYLRKADSLQAALNDLYKKDSVIFYNHEKNKPKYSTYTPNQRNAALDSLLRSRK